MAHRDPAVDVPSAPPALGTEQALLRGLLRDLLVGEEGHVPAGRRGGLDRSDRHGARLPPRARSCDRAGASPPPSSSSGGGLRSAPSASTSPRGIASSP